MIHMHQDRDDVFVNHRDNRFGVVEVSKGSIPSEMAQFVGAQKGLVSVRARRVR